MASIGAYRKTVMLRKTREASCMREIQMAQLKKIRVLRMVMRVMYDDDNDEENAIYWAEIH